MSNAPDPVDKASNDIVDMIASARAVKGDAFAAIATSWFESLQAVKVIAGIRHVTQAAGVDVDFQCNAAAHMIGVAAARIVDLLPDGDDDEAATLAKRLMAVVEEAQAAQERLQ